MSSSICRRSLPSLAAYGQRALAAVLGSALVALSSAATTLRAQAGQQAAQQAAEVIRGRVTSDSGKPLVAATVIVTRGPDRLVQQTTTDTAGNYRVRFEQGTGDYLVYVAATGYRAARRRVQRQGSEHELAANFVLAVDLAKLAATKVTAARPVRATNQVGPMQQEPGSSEKWSDGVNGQLPPTLAGDLSAIASTMPNITMTPDGPSILGSGPTSTLMTLNGMATGATSVPRAARTETRVTGTTYDATRGGFAGANIDVRLAQGNRNYEERNAYFTLDPPALQFTDPTSRSLGATNGGFRGSAGADGELIRRALTYNVSIDVTHNRSDPVTLLDAGGDAFLRAGVSPDSIGRLVPLASPIGLPLTGPSIPGARRHDAYSLLSRFDDTRDTLDHRTLTTYASYTSDGAQGFNVLAAPSASSERRQHTLGAQFVQDNYVGAGRRVLTETRFAASTQRTTTDPYLQTPAASVLVRSADTSGGNDISSILLGGGGSLASNNSSWIAEGANETMWNAVGRRHHFRALVWGRADGLRQESSPNALGRYTFNSIADFAAGRASSFTRTLAQPNRAGTTWNAATALSHEFAPSNFFSLIYGARLEADGFGSTPASNPALEQALGVRTGVAPDRLHLSPRFGFSYRYNRDRDNGNGMMFNQVGRFYRNATGTIRGGIGEFRDLLQPGTLADAMASTGLSGGTLLLSCVGSAVPVPDWERFAQDRGAIPSACADGSGVLGEQSPAVTLISPTFDVPRSWRASLDWTSNFGRWLVQAGTLVSYDLDQPGTIDANFAGTPKFTLRDEGDRPMFVSPAAIDPSSGAVSPSEARISNQFGSVNERVSDLRGYGGQFTLRLAPDVFKFRNGLQLYTSLGYTLQSIKREYRGFDGAGLGDPRIREWAPSNNDARHVFVASAGFNSSKVGSFTLFARAQSGLPFTPIVQGDVNGDGRFGDRAFVPDPARTADTLLAVQMRSLLANGSDVARNCVLANLGRIVGRNGCRGPWTESLNMQWSPRMPRRWNGRVTPIIYLQNVLAGVDELVHGTSGMHGWGAPAIPDPTLLVPRGFDASAQRFRYDVNARFADTRPGRSLLIDPFRLMIDFSINLTTNPDLQQLRRAVEPVRGPKGTWVRRSADSLTVFYLQQTSSVHKFLLAQSDSLFLSASQIAALRRADSTYSARVISLYRPLADYLAKGSGEAGKAELDSVTHTQNAYWKVFWEQPEIADSIITPAQRSLMPLVQNLLSVPKENREHSRFIFGNQVTLPKPPPAPRPLVPNATAAGRTPNE